MQRRVAMTVTLRNSSRTRKLPRKGGRHFWVSMACAFLVMKTVTAVFLVLTVLHVILQQPGSQRRILITQRQSLHCSESIVMLPAINVTKSQTQVMNPKLQYLAPGVSLTALHVIHLNTGQSSRRRLVRHAMCLQDGMKCASSSSIMISPTSSCVESMRS